MKHTLWHCGLKTENQESDSSFRGTLALLFHQNADLHSFLFLASIPLFFSGSAVLLYSPPKYFFVLAAC